MNEYVVLTDDAIRQALTPAASVRAPLDLSASIRAVIETTRQERPSFGARLLAPAARPLRILVLAALAALLAIVGLLLVAGQRGPSPLKLAADAPMFRGGPDRTNVVLGPGPSGQPTILWDQPVDGPISNNQPAIVGGVAYVADGNGGVSTFDAADGTPGWAVQLPSNINTSPAVADGLVIVAEADGTIVALDAATGVSRWTAHTVGTVRSSPAIANGVAYLGDDAGFLYAFDVASGNEPWQPFFAGGDITRSPAVADGLVFVGAGGGLLSAIDVTTGTRRWQTPLGPGQVPTPAVRDGLVMASSGADDPEAPHTLFAVDEQSGTIRGSWPSPSGQDLYVGAFDDGLVLVESQDDSVYAVNVESGGTVLTRRWAFETGGPVGSASAIAAGVAYIAGGDRVVYAVDEQTGALRWKVEVSGQPGAIAVVGDRVYVATDLGRVVAIGNTP
jgi:outer membrane protein assembly factor BamB